MGVKCRKLKTSTFQTLVVQEKAITIPTQYFYTLPDFAKELKYISGNGDNSFI